MLAYVFVSLMEREEPFQRPCVRSAWVAPQTVAHTLDIATELRLSVEARPHSELRAAWRGVWTGHGREHRGKMEGSMAGTWRKT